MERAKLVGMLAVWAVLGTACATVTLAPGADQVKMTQDPQDVAACKALGNVRVPEKAEGPTTSGPEFRNQVIGLGGNTGLVTRGGLVIPFDGIAYHCP